MSTDKGTPVSRQREEEIPIRNAIEYRGQPDDAERQIASCRRLETIIIYAVIGIIVATAGLLIAAALTFQPS